MTACPIEDRLAINDLIVSVATATDSMGNYDAILATFTEDAIYDLSSVGFGTFAGHAAIRSFFEAAWAGNSHFAHYLSNVAVTAYAGDSASAQAYVTGLARALDDSRSTVHARYYFDVVRTAHGWKIARYWMDVLIPPDLES